MKRTTSFGWKREVVHKNYYCHGITECWRRMYRMWVYPNDNEGLFITREGERYCHGGGGMYLSR